MKITAPIDKVEEVEPLIEAGADELYCGVYRSVWFSTLAEPNIKPASKASLKSFEDLKKITQKANKCGVPVYLTLNSFYHSEPARDLIRKDLAQAIDAGVNGFVVADIPMLKEMRERCQGKTIILSTMGNCFNTETALFFKDLGINRIVFPRDLSLSELGSLCADLKRENLNIPLEFFVQRLMCRNVNGFCKAHGFKKNRESAPEEAACILPYQAEFTSRADNSAETIEPFFIGERGRNICAACGIFYFAQFGIEYLKIIGRGAPTKRKIEDVVFISAFRDILGKQPVSFDDFFKEGQEIYNRTYGRRCRTAECHFPCFVQKKLEEKSNEG